MQWTRCFHAIRPFRIAQNRQYHECLHSQTVDRGSGCRCESFQDKKFQFGKHTVLSSSWIIPKPHLHNQSILSAINRGPLHHSLWGALCSGKYNDDVLVSCPHTNPATDSSGVGLCICRGAMPLLHVHALMPEQNGRKMQTTFPYVFKWQTGILTLDRHNYVEDDACNHISYVSCTYSIEFAHVFFRLVIVISRFILSSSHILWHWFTAIGAIAKRYSRCQWYNLEGYG